MNLPSIYNEIFWLTQDGIIKPEVFFYFLELFWPTFVKKDGFVFLKEKYSDEEFTRLNEENSDLEYWMNLLVVNDFFSDSPDDEEEAIRLAKALVETWRSKLEKDFPTMDFTVEYLWGEGYGDSGVTFYQTKKTHSHKEEKIKGTIPTPNIKESKLESSPNGLRGGMPFLRKPRPDEIPG